MKTIKQWLEESLTPYQFITALWEMEEQFSTGVLSNETECASDALSEAFKWSESRQGHKYWESLFFKLYNDEQENK